MVLWRGAGTGRGGGGGGGGGGGLRRWSWVGGSKDEVGTAPALCEHSCHNYDSVSPAWLLRKELRVRLACQISQAVALLQSCGHTLEPDLPVQAITVPQREDNATSDNSVCGRPANVALLMLDYRVWNWHGSIFAWCPVGMLCVQM